MTIRATGERRKDKGEMRKWRSIDGLCVAISPMGTGAIGASVGVCFR
ncbi:MAG: hypothetical protein ACKO65_01510 [Betaproteobacteria bacterium]